MLTSGQFKVSKKVSQRKHTGFSTSKSVNETMKVPVSRETQELAQILQPNIPVEQVIYLNDSKRVEHETGTNKYWVNYPESWRTVPNQHLILGVRAIRKYENKKRKFVLNLQISYYKNDYPEPEIHSMIIEMELSNESMRPENIPNFIYKIKSDWDNFYQTVPDDKKFVETLEVNVNDMNEVYMKMIMKEDFGSHWTGYSTVKANMYMQNNISKIETVYGRNPITSRDHEGVCITSSKYMFHEYDPTYLLSSSFVSSTNYNYLGFTNTEFNPPKCYEIPPGDTRFLVEISSPDGLSPRELNPDGRDLVAIEIQLTSVPYAKFI